MCIFWNVAKIRYSRGLLARSERIAYGWYYFSVINLLSVFLRGWCKYIFFDIVPQFYRYRREFVDIKLSVCSTAKLIGALNSNVPASRLPIQIIQGSRQSICDFTQLCTKVS